MQVARELTEETLDSYYSEIDAEKSKWKCIHFRLDRLQSKYKSNYQRKVCLSMTNEILNKSHGWIAPLSDFSIMIFCKDTDKEILNKLIFQMRYLFMDDPVVAKDKDTGDTQLYDLHDLNLHLKYVIEQTKKRMRGENDNEEKPDASNDNDVEENIALKHLVKIENDLKEADISSAYRRQPICVSPADGKYKKVFDELFINIAHLKRLLRMNVNFFSDMNLFRYLTLLLDHKVMTLLQLNPKRFFEPPVSININIGALLSDEFEMFDSTISKEAKAGIIFEISVVDVFGQMHNFDKARKKVQKLGYRVCIDGVTYNTIPHFNREELGFDMMKLQWNPKIPEAGKALKETLKTAVQKQGAKRIILCHCDDETAVNYGKALGIMLFQGRYLDSILNPSVKVQN